MNDLLGLLLSVFMLAVSCSVRPVRAVCPPAWYLNAGIRPTGDFQCAPSLVGGVLDPAGGVDTAVQPPGAIVSKIYCTNGQEPIVVDYRVVSCQARH